MESKSIQNLSVVEVFFSFLFFLYFTKTAYRTGFYSNRLQARAISPLAFESSRKHWHTTTKSLNYFTYSVISITVERFISFDGQVDGYSFIYNSCESKNNFTYYIAQTWQMRKYYNASLLTYPFALTMSYTKQRVELCTWENIKFNSCVNWYQRIFPSCFINDVSEYATFYPP